MPFLWSNSGLLTPLPVAVSMPWFPCRIAGKVADGCKATWTNAQRLPRRGEPPRRSRWGGGESTARRIKRPRRYTHPSQKPNQKLIWFGFCFALIFNTHTRLGVARLQARAPPCRVQNGSKRSKSLSEPKPLFSKCESMLGSLNMIRIYNLLIL